MFELTSSGLKKRKQRGSKENGVNAVNFLFNPDILVGKTVICCLAYVKL